MTKEEKIKVGIRKEHFDHMMTEFGRENSGLRESEHLDVHDVDLDEEFVILSATLSERTVQ